MLAAAGADTADTAGVVVAAGIAGVGAVIGAGDATGIADIVAEDAAAIADYLNAADSHKSWL